MRARTLLAVIIGLLIGLSASLHRARADDEIYIYERKGDGAAPHVQYRLHAVKQPRYGRMGHPLTHGHRRFTLPNYAGVLAPDRGFGDLPPNFDIYD